MRSPLLPSRPRERGAALIVVLIAMFMAASIAGALVVLALSRSRALRTRVEAEASLACAEGGLDRGIAEANLPANRTSTTWPPAGLKISSSPNDGLLDARLNQVGHFLVTFARGDTDGVDNDGDALIDAADAVDEAQYVTIESTGYFATSTGGSPYTAKLRAYVLKTTISPQIQSAIFIDDPNPDITLGSSASYRLQGGDHDMTTRAPLPGGFPALATSGAFNAPDQVDITAHAATGQVSGTPGPSQNGAPDNVDITSIIALMKEITPPAQQIVVSGVNPPGPFGIPPGQPGGPDWQLSLHLGYTKMTGNKMGAGFWVIDGDLDIGGTLIFTGIIIVRGKVSFSGGGSGTQVTGAIISSEAPVIDFTVTGTTDIFYSSGAVSAASRAASRYLLRAWQVLPKP